MLLLRAMFVISIDRRAFEEQKSLRRLQLLLEKVVTATGQPFDHVAQGLIWMVQVNTTQGVQLDVQTTRRHRL